MRLWIANVLAGLLFGPPIVISHVFWWFWGMWGAVLGLIAGREEQVRIWHTVQVGPTYSSTLLGPLWSYFGHEVEGLTITSYPAGAPIHSEIDLQSVQHERMAFTVLRTRTHPIWNMGGAESRPVRPASG